MLALIAAIAAAILLLPDGSRPDSAPRPTPPQIMVKPGDTAPDFTVEMFDGSHVTSPTCAARWFCSTSGQRGARPAGRSLHACKPTSSTVSQAKTSSSCPSPAARAAKPWRLSASSRATLPMGLDPQRRVYDRYASNHIPRNILIGRDGRIVLSSVGYEADEFGRLVEAIEQTLNQ